MVNKSQITYIVERISADLKAYPYILTIIRLFSWGITAECMAAKMAGMMISTSLPAMSKRRRKKKNKKKKNQFHPFLELFGGSQEISFLLIWNADEIRLFWNWLHNIYRLPSIWNRICEKVEVTNVTIVDNVGLFSSIFPRKLLLCNFF